MAAISITAANVLASGGTKRQVGTAGATITAGQVLYKDATHSNSLKLADADSTAATAVARTATATRAHFTTTALARTAAIAAARGRFAAIVLNAIFLKGAWDIWRRAEAVAEADAYAIEKRFFRFSLYYLFLHFGALLADAGLRSWGMA